MQGNGVKGNESLVLAAQLFSKPKLISKLKTKLFKRKH